jgi:hypothetical protein
MINRLNHIWLHWLIRLNLLGHFNQMLIIQWLHVQIAYDLRLAQHGCRRMFLPLVELLLVFGQPVDHHLFVLRTMPRVQLSYFVLVLGHPRVGTLHHLGVRVRCDTVLNVSILLVAVAHEQLFL